MPTHLAAFDDWRGLEGVPSAAAAARDAIDVLLRDRGLRQTSPALTTESLLIGAVASAQLEGGDAGLEEVRSGKGDDHSAATLRLNSELLALIPVIKRSPLQAFARMHALAAAGTVDADAVGRPRAADGVAPALQQLSAGLLQSEQVPGVVAAAVAHAELARIAPFASHNAVVARGLERLVLVARGVDPTSMLVPEAGHLALQPDYERALAAYATKTPAGLQSWLSYATGAIAAAVEASPLRGR